MIGILLVLYSLNFVAIDSAHYTEEFLASVPPVDFSKANASKTDVIYHLFTSSQQADGIVLDTHTVSAYNFNRNLPTKFLIHGFTTDLTSPWYAVLKREYLAKGPHNIFYIDWSKAGNLTFAESSANVDPVGEFVADFLIAAKVPQENIHLIGHSLGSHLTGFAGKYVWKKTGRRIGRITALDPAGPAFNKLAPYRRLCKDDANFVDVIHTDIDYYGFTKPCGHVDFYPNAGKNQPGCKSHEEDDNCSHARSTLFFAESINYRKAEAVKARFNENNGIVAIEDGNKVVFGDATPVFVRGIYCVRTNSSAPFLNASEERGIS